MEHAASILRDLFVMFAAAKVLIDSNSSSVISAYSLPVNPLNSISTASNKMTQGNAFLNVATRLW